MLKMTEVRPAGKKGRGIFALRTIAKGTVIEVSPYILLPSEDFEDLQTTVIRYYWFYVNKGRNGSPTCAIALGTASLYNHSKNPNADWQIMPRAKKIKITALRDIHKGQEVTINYGYDVKKCV